MNIVCGLYRYCSEVLSALPFGLPDEPLYVVYTINRVVQVRGGELEANMKTIITDGALGTMTKHLLEIMAAEKVREGDEAYNLNAVAQEPESQNHSEVHAEVGEDTAGVPEEVLEKLRVRTRLCIISYLSPAHFVNVIMVQPGRHEPVN